MYKFSTFIAMRYLLWLTLVIGSIQPTFAQHFLSIQSGITVGNSGVLNQTGISLYTKKNSFTVGGQISLRQSYVFGRKIFGLYANWKYHLLENKRLSSFIGANVQSLIYKPVVRGVELQERNSVIEYSLIQGVEYVIWKGLVIGEWLGIGRFAERLLNLQTKKITVFDGTDFSGKVYLAYQF